MKTLKLSACVIAIFAAMNANAVELNGKNLTQQDAWAIAEGAPVSIAPEAMNRVQKSYDLVWMPLKTVEKFTVSPSVSVSTKTIKSFLPTVN